MQALATAIDAFADATAVASVGGLADLLHAESPLRTALTTALRAAAAAAPTQPTEPAGLPDGRFWEALETVSQAYGIRSLGEMPPAPEPAPQPPLPPEEKNWALRITAAGEPRTGSTLELSADLDVAEGRALPATLQTRWWINGVPQQSSGPGGLHCVHTPQPGSDQLKVDVEVNSGPPANRTESASTTLLVRQSEDREIADQLEVEANTISRMQTAVAAAVIVFAGYAIFHSAFVGSFANITAALFWGFGIDISVAKALEYSTPFTTKKLS